MHADFNFNFCPECGSKTLRPHGIFTTGKVITWGRGAVCRDCGKEWTVVLEARPDPAPAHIPSSDAEVDGWHDYAFWCMDQAGWKPVDCQNCGCPRMQKGNVLEECPECGDGQTALSAANTLP